MASSKPVGKTASQGWQIGVRRTLPVSEPQAWRLMLTVLCLTQHMPADGAAFPPGTTLATDDGTCIEVRSSYWVALAVHLHEAGYQVAVVNPMHLRNDARSLPRRAKTDALDAQLLAHCATRACRPAGQRTVA